jgi:hypothetical protein
MDRLVQPQSRDLETDELHPPATFVNEMGMRITTAGLADSALPDAEQRMQLRHTDVASKAAHGPISRLTNQG